MKDCLKRFRTEEGSAVADFALISAMLMMLVFGCIQLALTLWVRTALTDIAGEAARTAAAYEDKQGVHSSQIATGRAVELSAPILGEHYVSLVETKTYLLDKYGNREGQTPVKILAVTLQGNIPMLGWLPGATMEVTGRAVLESGPLP